MLYLQYFREDFDQFATLTDMAVRTFYSYAELCLIPSGSSDGTFSDAVL